jgi:hypothetical protein
MQMKTFELPLELVRQPSRGFALILIFLSCLLLVVPLWPVLWSAMKGLTLRSAISQMSSQFVVLAVLTGLAGLGLMIGGLYAFTKRVHYRFDGSGFTKTTLSVVRSAKTVWARNEMELIGLKIPTIGSASALGAYVYVQQRSPLPGYEMLPITQTGLELKDKFKFGERLAQIMGLSFVVCTGFGSGVCTPAPKFLLETDVGQALRRDLGR